MLRRFTLSDLFRKAWFPLIIVGLAYYFGSSMMTGQNGYYARKDTLVELELKRAELEVLQTTRQALDKKVSLMAPDNLDPDLLDEQARLVLGLAGDKELVIILDEDDDEETPATN